MVNSGVWCCTPKATEVHGVVGNEVREGWDGVCVCGGGIVIVAMIFAYFNLHWLLQNDYGCNVGCF